MCSFKVSVMKGDGNCLLIYLKLKNKHLKLNLLLLVFSKGRFYYISLNVILFPQITG